MGPSPTRRSGHAMATSGTQVFVLGGESLTAEKPKDPSIIHVLDCRHINYPWVKPPRTRGARNKASSGLDLNFAFSSQWSSGRTFVALGNSVGSTGGTTHLETSHQRLPIALEDDDEWVEQDDEDWLQQQEDDEEEWLQAYEMTESPPQSPPQHPHVRDFRSSPTHPALVVSGAAEGDSTQVNLSTKATQSEYETILQSALGDLTHLSVPPSRLTIMDSTQIGCGKYGEVLLAKLVGSSQAPILVAVKELRPIETRGVRQRIALRLVRELKIWAKVSHPNILPLVGYYLSENYEIARFISPFMINGNVSQYLGRVKLGVLGRLDIIRDVTAGMNYLHSCSPHICHGDLKPPNILINDTLRAVLCDFGLATFIQESGISSGLTTSRSIKGSLRYMSPELSLVDDAKHTLASDVWAWGCTAFEIITDCVPYKRATKDTTVLFAIVQKEPPGSIDTLMSHMPHSTSSTIPPAIQGLQHYLPLCWNFDAEQRPQMTSILRNLFPQ
ncbi:hypothetical protein FRC01_008732 [Tulasnella sp. 417]|nr:hypothetical protein FRC01_008732 [Tulasnella sp. 417]